MPVAVEPGRYDPHHPVFAPLHRDAVLWRFMDFAKFVALLDRSALHFSRSDLLGDPFEGSLSVPAKEAASESGPNSEESRREWRSKTLISCWNHSNYEVDALWSTYSTRDAGIAIRTTFERLSLCFGEPYAQDEPQASGVPVLIGRIKYVDYATSGWPTSNAFWPYVHKRLSFQHEQEVRAVVTSHDLDGFPESRMIRVDLDRLIESIVVSPLAAPWFAELVESTAARFGVSAPVVQSALAAIPEL